MTVRAQAHTLLRTPTVLAAEAAAVLVFVPKKHLPQQADRLPHWQGSSAWTQDYPDPASVLIGQRWTERRGSHRPARGEPIAADEDAV